MKRTAAIGLVLTLVGFGLSGCDNVSQPTEESPSFGLALGNEKVTICHDGSTITVGEPAVVATHLAHGDAEGPCGPACVALPSGLVSWWPGDGNAQDIIDGNNGTLV